MIIDVHAHVWPDHIAARMVAARPAGMDAVGDGTVDGLLRTMDDAGIDFSCTLAIANEARHVRRTNEFIGGLDRSRFIPFGTVHSGLTVEENLSSLRENGIVGVKFHPNFQNMSLGEPATLEIFQALAANAIPVLTHTGAGSDACAHERGAPHHIGTIVDAVPDLTLIAAHFGGYHRLDDAEVATQGRNVIIETSWPPHVGELGAEQVRGLIERHGADRVVFGSDWPMARPADEMAFISSLGLSDEDRTAVLGNNIAALLGIGESRKVSS